MVRKTTKKTTAKKAAKKTTARKSAARKTTKKTTAKKAVRKAVRKTTAKARKTVKRAVKKATRKAVRKTTNKRAKDVEVYHLSQPAPEDKYFVLANGQPIQHVAELAEVLNDLEDHVFNHHVNPEKNDFHNWVKDVFNDVQLAKKMLGVSDKKHLQLVIYKHAAKKALKR